jgi:hypothetical protein
MMQQSGMTYQTIPAYEVLGTSVSRTTLPAGTRYVIEIDRFVWFGREGVYSEISLPGDPDRRYRVDYHRLNLGSRA